MNGFGPAERTAQEILKDTFLAHDVRAALSLVALRADIPSERHDRLRLGIERYVALTQAQAANSGFILNRVKSPNKS